MNLSNRTLAATVLCGAAALALGACGDDAGDTAAATTAAAPADMGAPAAGGAGDPASVTCVAGEGGEVTVEIVDFLFAPTPAEVTAGSTVTFANRDAFPHSIWSAEREGGARVWESVGSDAAARSPENLATDASSTCTFPTAGTYEYICGIHNTMRGTITVG